MHPLLMNREPVDYTSTTYAPLFHRLQGNIVKSHGRDVTANLFLTFKARGSALREALRWLATNCVTSAYRQHRDTEAFTARRAAGDACSGDPTHGAPFGVLFLRPGTYRKLGYSQPTLETWFADPPFVDQQAPQNATFVGGMLRAAGELGDTIDAGRPAEPLERAYVDGSIDALLLLAGDRPDVLRERVGTVTATLAASDAASVVAEVWGHVRRDAACRRIEPFGFVDGVSQPLFLVSDFAKRQAGFTAWDPFAPLSLALVKDPAVEDPLAFGSYYVVRRLEQDVEAFRMVEDLIAGELGLEPHDSERAGAMLVGRFRDGTPLAHHAAPSGANDADNDFRYDGLDPRLNENRTPGDAFGLKCPFHAHIRKMNPRQSVNVAQATATQIGDDEQFDRARAIVRRGIPYGTLRDDGTPPAVGDPAVHGLLFACYQRSISRQFAFLQKRWANQPAFKIDRSRFGVFTGLDPIIGKPIFGGSPHQRWRQEWGGDPPTFPRNLETDLDLKRTHPKVMTVGPLVRFRGGEFFFAPSLTFLLGEST